MRVLLAHTRKVLAEIAAKHAGQTFEKVNRDMERNSYMSAEAAEACGVINEVIMGAQRRAGGQEVSPGVRRAAAG